MEITVDNLADKLPQLRAAYGVTQVQVAQGVGLTHGAYSALELGKARPRYATLEKLKTYFEEWEVSTADIRHNPHEYSITIALNSSKFQDDGTLLRFAQREALIIRAKLLPKSTPKIELTQIVPARENSEGQLQPWQVSFFFHDPVKYRIEKKKAKARSLRARKAPADGVESQ